MNTARSTLHAAVREAIVPLGVRLVQREMEVQKPRTTSELWRGLRSSVRELDPNDQASTHHATIGALQSFTVSDSVLGLHSFPSFPFPERCP